MQPTRTNPTGKEVIIAGTVSPCSIPDLIPPKHTSVPYAETSSGFSFQVCREYASYDVTVTGSSWNTQDSVIPGTTRTFARLEAANPSMTSLQVPMHETRQGAGDYSVKTGDWAAANMQVLLGCQQGQAQANNAALPVSATECR